MSILQFEPPNLEFICKRYEINRFWNSKYKIRPISTKKIKSRGLSARNQGLGCKNQGWRVNFQKVEGSFNKFPNERVSGDLGRSITDQRLRLDLSASARAGVRPSADKRVRGVSGAGAGLADRSGPAVGARARARTRATGSELDC
jgi:hypothetical protein